MKKKELWLALSALGVVATPNVDAAERAGVASKVNPSVEQLSMTGSRVLFVGNDIFRDETIRTDNSGQTNLMFLDKSSLLIGPNSEMVIDQFVYDPVSNTGELSMSAKKGILRFVGGALSKTGDVSINIPVGNLGIRGAIVLVEIEEISGDIVAYLIYGKELTFKPLSSDKIHTLAKNETSMRIGKDGSVKIMPILPQQIQKLNLQLQGSKSTSPPSSNRQVSLPISIKQTVSSSQKTSPPKKRAVRMRDLTGQVSWDRLEHNEYLNVEVKTRDIDQLISQS